MTLHTQEVSLEKQTFSKTESKPKRKRTPVNRPSLPKGTTLMREWKGTTHHVIVVDGGYEYQNTCYSSLSAIALKITGAHWNGWLFFKDITAPETLATIETTETQEQHDKQSCDEDVVKQANA